MFLIALYCAQYVDWIIRTFHLGAGSTWPGEVALRIDPLFISHSLFHSSTKSILVAGTNGKTTTSLLIVDGLKKAGRTVIHNSEGANLLNGVATALVRGSMLIGSVRAEFAVFELDENALTLALDQIQRPHAIILLNLFRDQLDRYGEVNTISTRWMNALQLLPKETNVIINADDPRLAFIGKKINKQTSYFGAETKDKEKKEIPHDVDSVYCPECGKKLVYSVMSYSHLGDYDCPHCHFSSPVKWEEPIKPMVQLSGVYNRYNIRAAVLLLHDTLSLSYEDARRLLNDVPPAFGRQEHFSAEGKDWILILSKNPSGFNQSIESLKELLQAKKTTVCIVLNDRIPDGHDVSWIWDVEFDAVFNYAHTVIVTGDRTYDMAIRMKTPLRPTGSSGFAGQAGLIAEPILKQALQKCVLNQEETNPIVILATYTGMLEVRKLLKGRALL